MRLLIEQRGRALLIETTTWCLILYPDGAMWWPYDRVTYESKPARWIPYWPLPLPYPYLHQGAL